ncbi:carboxymuconolactone decarboxylase family protein [Epilithonimonas sp.]|jgi:AhpD family alkylhydroperoxidase|uniref:carboxymuconolactone decarboxylase family protein n=1 Tax=Epilithonimonas sp. TaxID=2894511 RepID=UPI0035B31697
MEKRINISKTDSQAYKAMLGLEGYLAQSGISKTIKELIKIRASQINGCAYCLDMHTKDAIKYGETAERIFLISAWHEAEKFFSEEEKTALKMTEEITLINQHGLTEETYQKAKSIFSEKQIAELIMAIITINSWNRIALSTRLEIGE